MIDELRNRRVGLIGANGFVGSAILQALLRTGVTPRVLCGLDSVPRPIPDGIDSLTCDLTDAEALKSWVSELDVIIHAAGPPSVKQSFEMPKEYVRVHVQGTAAVAHACHEAGVDRLVYISSAEVYGRPNVKAVSESHRLQARSPYAAAKIGAEKIIEAYAESFGLKAVILRPFSIYGPNPTPESLLGTIIAKAHAGCVRLWDLRPVRDYCYVGDLATAAVQASCLVTEKLKIFNVGTGKGTSVAEFAALVLRSMGANLPVLEDRFDTRPSESEIFELVADISLARNVLGWRADTDVEEGLRKTFAVCPGKA